MLERILNSFPPHTHPLTLVSDPDGVLADEQIRAALAERGFRMIDERDPIALRYAVQQARPWSATTPLIVVTEEPVNTLPYDLWQPGHHVTLALHTLFPNLAYPVVQALSPRQRRRLSEVLAGPQAPAAPLSYEGTMRYILEAVFGITPGRLPRPAQLIAWLDDYHALDDPLPPELLRKLLEELKRVPAFAGWPLADLLGSGESYRSFVRDAWAGATQPPIREAGVAYTPTSPIPFGSDPALQEMVPRLLRSGTLRPVDAAASPGLPGWAQPAIAGGDEQAGLRRFVEGLNRLDQQLKGNALRWKE